MRIPIPEFTNYYVTEVRPHEYIVVTELGKPVKGYAKGDLRAFILTRWGYEYHVSLKDLLYQVCLGPEWQPGGKVPGLTYFKKEKISELPPKPEYKPKKYQPRKKNKKRWR